MSKGNTLVALSASVVAACTVFGIQGAAYAYGPHSGSDSSPKSNAIHYLTELSERRRLTTIFDNEQSPFYGVQVSYTNTAEGNLTFLNRDLVRLDRVPIVFGRVYDSRLGDTADFGPGWKLAATETVIRKGNKFEYTDAANSTYTLSANGEQLVSEYPHLTGVARGQLLHDEIIVRHLGMMKRFSRYKNNSYRLTNVTDNSGNAIFLHYTDGLLSSISSTNDRRIDILRNADSQIVSATDDGGRSVSFEYNDNGQLVGFNDTGGESWRYTYDKHGYLTKISDPRNVDILQAQFSGKKVSRVNVQHKSFSFRYKGYTTEVADALDRTAIFVAHGSGLTQSVRDFSGKVTSLVLNNHLEAVSLEFDGTTIAHIDYDNDYRQRQIIRFDADEPRIFTFTYEGNLLESVYSNSQPTAAYTYDAYGNVLRAQYELSSRQYVRTADGSIDEIGVDGVVLGTDTNQFGVITELTRNGQPLAAFSFDAADRIERLDVWESGNPYEMRFEYAPSGFRNVGKYPDDLELKFDYDAVGNLTTLEKILGDGTVYEYEYSVGARNELYKVQGPYGDPLFYEYDALGRVTNVAQGDRTADVKYDDVGRLVGIAFDGKPRFTIDYSSMDMDAIEAADTKSNNTFVPYPIASHVFGSLNSIAYARPRGSVHGAIRFNPTMLRFVIAEEPFAQPDGVDFASFKRRMLPLGEGGLSASPLGFDKPSNNLFLPPEFYSSNCVICAGATSGATIHVNNSTAPTIASVGQTVPFNVTSDSFCEEIEEQKPRPGRFRHAFQFGDGTGEVKTSTLPFAQFEHSYSNSGTYIASYNIKCSCEPLFDSSDTHTVHIIGGSYPSAIDLALTFDDGPHETLTGRTVAVLNTLQAKAAALGKPVRASFYVERSRIDSSTGESIIALMKARGHEVAIHGVDPTHHVKHQDTVSLPSKLTWMKSTISSATGGNPIQVRPPGGWGGWTQGNVYSKSQVASIYGQTNLTRYSTVEATGGVNSWFGGAYSRTGGCGGCVSRPTFVGYVKIAVDDASITTTPKRVLLLHDIRTDDSADIGSIIDEIEVYATSKGVTINYVRVADL